MRRKTSPKPEQNNGDSTHLIVHSNPEKIRDEISGLLKFTFMPLAHKGRSKEFSLSEYLGGPLSALASKLLIAIWETSTSLAAVSVDKKVGSVRRFLTFLHDHKSGFLDCEKSKSLKHLNYKLIRDFELWLRASNTRDLSLADERIKTLRTRLQYPLPIHKIRKEVSIVNLNISLGWPSNYIQQHDEMMNLVRSAAIHHGQVLRASKVVARSAISRVDRKLSARNVEEIYSVITQLLKYLHKYQPAEFAPNFLVPAILLQIQRGPVKTPALDHAEHKLLRQTCLKKVKEIKRRLLIEGPTAAAKGNPNIPRNNFKQWIDNDNNLFAYIDLNLFGNTKRKSIRDDIRRILAAKKTAGETLRPVDLKQMLAPGMQDLIPFLILMGMNKDAPLNMSSLLSLHWEPDNSSRHCLQHSPTPHCARIFFQKDRAQLDHTFIDVPDRGDYDLPGLIRSVADITEIIRSRFDFPERNSLWVTFGPRNKFVVLNQSYAPKIFRDFIIQNRLKPTNPETEFYFRRLRPTIISDVALSSGLEKAKRIASHANPSQTLAYVLNPTSTQRLDKAVSRVLSKAITSITTGFSKRPTRREVRELASELGVSDGIALEIVLGKRDKLFNACIDDNNGAGPVAAGKRCGKFESCLVCANSVIVERHLPRLISNLTQWEDMQSQLPIEVWNEDYALNCAIAHEHLSKFEPRVIAEAKRLVEESNFHIVYSRFKQT